MQAEAPLEHDALLRAEFADPVVDDRLHALALRAAGRLRVLPGLEPIDGPVVVVARSRADHDAAVQLHQPLDVGRIPVELRRDFRLGRLAVQPVPEPPRRPQAGVDVLDDVDRHPHRGRLVHDRALDRLPDPPGRVGRKAEAAFGIEFLDGVNQAEVAFLDQIQKGQAAIQVAARDLDDEPQVGLDHALARSEVTAARAARQLLFLVRRQQR